MISRKIQNLLAPLNRLMHREYKINVNNLNINIVETGEGKNTLLLMPGTLGSSWSNFKPQIQRLPKLLPNFKVISWDPPGYGKSVPPERSFQLDLFENDARNAIDLMWKLKREKFSVLGWSAGGITALIMAGRYPECVNKLVVWGNGAYITKKEVNNFEAIRDTRQWPENIRNELVQIYGTERLTVMWSAWIDLLHEFLIKRKGDFCCADLGHIKAPTFILRGAKDGTISAEHAPHLIENIKSTKYHEFPNGAHSIHITEADQFNTLVAKFLLENYSDKMK